jgi:undecaprenyl pyrophosphate phosphatase UppP
VSNSVFMKIGSKLALEAIVMVRIAIPRNQMQDPTIFKRFFFVGYVVGYIELCAILFNYFNGMWRRDRDSRDFHNNDYNQILIILISSCLSRLYPPIWRQ